MFIILFILFINYYFIYLHFIYFEDFTYLYFIILVYSLIMVFIHHPINIPLVLLINEIKTILNNKFNLNCC